MHDGGAPESGGRDTDAGNGINGRRQDSPGEAAGAPFAKKAKFSTQAEQRTGTEGGAGREREAPQGQTLLDAVEGQTLHDAVPNVLMAQEGAKNVMQVRVPGLIARQRLSARCLRAVLACLRAACASLQIAGSVLTVSVDFRCLPADCLLSDNVGAQGPIGPSDERSREPVVGGREALARARDADGQGARQSPRALPRTGSNDSRGSKRPRSDSPRTDVPGGQREGTRDSGHRHAGSDTLAAAKPEGCSKEGCSKVDQVLQEAVTRSALLSGLVPYLEEKQRSGDAALQLNRSGMSALQVLHALQRILEVGGDVGQGNEPAVCAVEAGERRLVDAMVRCLGDRWQELSDIKSLTRAAQQLMRLEYFGSDASADSKTAGRHALTGLVKQIRRLAVNLRADEVVDLFEALSCAGRDAGELLLDPKASADIVQRSASALAEMRADALIKFVKSLHALDTELPDRIGDMLASQLKSVVCPRDKCPPVAPDPELLMCVSRMRLRTNARHDLMRGLADKMRGSLKAWGAQALAQTIVLFAERDINLSTAVLKEFADEAEKRVRQCELSPRQATDILWALCVLDWRDNHDGKVASELVHASVCLLEAQMETEGEACAESPWSPCVEDEDARSHAAPGASACEAPTAGEMPTGDDADDKKGAGLAETAAVALDKATETPAAQTSGAGCEGSGQEQDEHQVTPVCITSPPKGGKDTAGGITVDSGTDVKEKLLVPCNGGMQMSSESKSSDGGLGCLGAARLLWALAQTEMLDRGRKVFDLVEVILCHGWRDLQARELADLVWAAEKLDTVFKGAMHQKLCLAAVQCMEDLQAGEIAVTLSGLMCKGHALPANLLDAAIGRLRAVRSRLSVSNCCHVLRELVKCSGWAAVDAAEHDEASAAHEGWFEVARAREWELRKKLARELIEELSHLSEKLDAKAMAQLMRAVAVFGVKLSAEHGHALCRRALAVLNGAGDRRGAGRGGSRGAGLDGSQLVDVVGGFIAWGVGSDDIPNAGDGMGRQRGGGVGGDGAAVVVVLCEELRDRMDALPSELLASAFIAVAVGGAKSKWNAFDIVDNLSARIRLPAAAAGTKAAACRRELLTALLRALNAKRAELDASVLMDVICACAFSQQSCGAAELMLDPCLALILQDASDKMMDISDKIRPLDASRLCAVLVVIVMHPTSLASTRALVDICAHLAATRSTLSCRELALALNAMAELNQEAVAESFCSMAVEATTRINARQA